MVPLTGCSHDLPANHLLNQTADRDYGTTLHSPQHVSFKQLSRVLSYCLKERYMPGTIRCWWRKTQFPMTIAPHGTVHQETYHDWYENPQVTFLSFLLRPAILETQESMIYVFQSRSYFLVSIAGHWSYLCTGQRIIGPSSRKRIAGTSLRPQVREK